MHAYPSVMPELIDRITDGPVHHRVESPSPAPTPPPAKSFVHLRRNRPVLILLPRTKGWLASLPPRVRPTCLATQYARIANRLCAAWDDPPECREILDDLLIDRRGGRKGFPKPVVRELQVLSIYYCIVHPYFNAVAPSRALAAA